MHAFAEKPFRRLPTAEEPRTTVSRLKSRYSIRDPALIYGNYRLQNNRVTGDGAPWTRVKIASPVGVDRRQAHYPTVASYQQSATTR